MKVRDIIAAIEDFAPAALQEDYDNTGLQIGSPEQEVHGVLVGFDCTEALVQEAVSRGCDMIITHHPLIFHPLRTICPSDPVGATVVAAIKAGVAVYASHTAADKTPDGVSWTMARKLGLQDVRVLVPEAPGVGFGVIGELPEALPAAEAVALVKKAFGAPVVRTSPLIKEPIRTLAMCGGSGSSLIGKAMEAGAQMYICGDISYHCFFVPEGFMVVDTGHFETEVEIVGVLLSVIRKKFPNFVSLMSDRIGTANPVNYL
ncbi:MAG: Nif3-like dinuclear metal center hexameric protein [Bacteroidales bacterium]|nr:Nif3-like dinuclear metal center hexameric protein [Bacteroidales bacterium]